MLDILLSVNAWAIDSRYFNIYQPLILKRIAEGMAVNDLFAGEKEQAKPGIVTATSAYRSTLYQSAIKGGQGGAQPVTVQVIRVKGTMLKEVGYCQAGTSTARVAAALEEAYQNREVDAIVLAMDTPGGSVDGTEYLGNVVKQGSKPVVTFVDGLTASAGYWVASQTRHIVMSSKTTSFVGSVGTLIAHLDESGWLAKEGLKVTYITADASVHKVMGNSSEALSPEAYQMFKERLNSINDTFVATVKEGRGKRLSSKENVFSAKVYDGRQAIEYGMADSIGTLKDAINIAASMVRNSNSNSPKSNANTEMIFPKLSALFGQTDASASAEVTEIQAQQAESALAEKDIQIATLQAQLGERDEKITALNTELSDQAAEHQEAAAALQATIDSQTATITRLEGWQKEHQVRDTRQQDQANSLSSADQVKVGWEDEAARRQAAAQKSKAK